MAVVVATDENAARNRTNSIAFSRTIRDLRAASRVCVSPLRGADVDVLVGGKAFMFTGLERDWLTNNTRFT